MQKTAEGDIPKETTIALEVFGKSNFDPSESTLVRVYVYNLRKKLDDYYAEEGKAESLRLTIPKGSYGVALEPMHQTTVAEVPLTVSEATPKQRSWWPLYLLLALASGFLLASLLFSRKNPSPATTNPFFEEVLTNDKSTMFVLGDMFLYSEFDSIRGDSRSIRNSRINSKEQFAAVKTKEHRPQTTIKPRDYTFLISNSTKWVKTITELFHAREKEFSIRLRTDLTTEELRSNDLIVVGMTKTIGPFQAYFNGSRFDYRDYDEYHYVDDERVNWCFSPEGTSDDYHTDYGLIARFPGPRGHTIHLFTGFWDSATSLALDLLTQEALREEVEQRMRQEWGEIPEYYELFFRLKGVDRLELDYDLLYLHRVDPESVSW